MEVYTKEELDKLIQQEVKPLIGRIAELEKALSSSLTGLASTKKVCQDLGIDRTTLIKWRNQYNLPAYSPTNKNIFWDIKALVEFIKGE